MVFLSPERHLSCPNCEATGISRDPNPARQVFHQCPGLKGLTAPLVEGQCKVETVDRGDYENGDRAMRDGEGRVVMAVKTTRDDGEDALVFAPTATLKDVT